jgi:hypothetical protein
MRTRSKFKKRDFIFLSNYYSDKSLLTKKLSVEQMEKIEKVKVKVKDRRVIARAITEKKKKLKEMTQPPSKKEIEVRNPSKGSFIQMKVFLKPEHKEWLRKKAFDERSNMSFVLRDILDKEMGEQD